MNVIDKEEWDVAKLYFLDSSLKKASRKHLNTIQHSFIKIDNIIYGIAYKKYLGTGGFSIVKKIINENNEYFALKIIKFDPQLAKEREQNKRDYELDILKLIGDYISHVIINNKMYIVMKFIDGLDLYDALYTSAGVYKNIFTYTEKILIAYNCALELKKLHDKNIIHADIKSENFKIDNFFNIKIIDFGLSIIIPSDKSCFNTYSNICGTPMFLAPEVNGSNFPLRYSKCSDIYSLGIMFKRDLYLDNQFYKHLLHTDPLTRWNIDELAIFLLKFLMECKDLPENALLKI